MSEPQRAIVGLLAGRCSLREAKAAGVSLSGDLSVLSRLEPPAALAEAV